jgi:hypothetical protein
MWRLIKAEISYIKYWIAAGCVLLLYPGIMTLLHYDRHVIYERYWALIVFALSRAVFWQFLACLVLLYLYMMESRVRRIVTMPVTTVQILGSRLLTPLIIMSIFLLASLLPLVAISIVWWHEILERLQAATVYDTWYEGSIPWFYGSVRSCVYFGLFQTYGLWLMSERYGWYLLGTYFVLIAVLFGVLPLFDSRLAWGISDAVSYVLGSRGSVYPAYFAVGFIALTIISFRTRRSYMR